MKGMNPNQLKNDVAGTIQKILQPNTDKLPNLITTPHPKKHWLTSNKTSK